MPEHAAEGILSACHPASARQAELARDPARSDALIAAAARCTPRTVIRQRRALERRGTIAPVPSGQRQHAWAAWPSRNPGATARVLAQLAQDPARSNRLIAAEARAGARTIRRIRRDLEAAGPIPRTTGRTQRTPPPRKPGRTRRPILAGAVTTREIRAIAGVSQSAVWWARRHRSATDHAGTGAG